MSIQAPISLGELLDKLTILELKLRFIDDEARLQNVRREFVSLSAIERSLALPDEIAELRDTLREVNARLWDVERDLRARESVAVFDERFVALARSVYRENDERARIKRLINELVGSELVEEKSHSADAAVRSPADA